MQFSESIPVNALRQFVFCPRIPYYQMLLNINVSKPIWTEQGRALHERVEALFLRRSFKRFALNKAQILYRVSIHSDTLQIHGIADCLLLAKEEVVPLEFKLEGKKPGKGHILQLLAYGCMASEFFNKKFSRGFIVYGDRSNSVHQVAYSPEKQQALFATIEGVTHSLSRMLKPDSSATAAKCSQCEYLSHCNDRDI